MILYSSPTNLHSHRVRVVVAEKNIGVRIVQARDGSLPPDIQLLNPYNTLPTLVDRELAVYNSRIIINYLDERFPQPPLMPVDPKRRAHFRLALHRIEHDLYGLAEKIESGGGDGEKRQLREATIEISEAVESSPFFLGEEFSLVDCSLAPLLWRLASYGIDPGPRADALYGYMRRVFARPAFTEGLSELERDMRPPAP
ncbi:MAG: glutathione S-transferase N-terminal domain-containing protein [Gammaproteobacteria bacterium]|nr:glutathione S-transferase N-terminal domain-containing protein [Gammaproteobacteria bacterium]